MEYWDQRSWQDLQHIKKPQGELEQPCHLAHVYLSARHSSHPHSGGTCTFQTTSSDGTISHSDAVYIFWFTQANGLALDPLLSLCTHPF